MKPSRRRVCCHKQADAQPAAGKTTLAKGIVQGLGAAPTDEVSSPTFTLIHEYSPRVIHIDLYRLDRHEEVATLGLEEIFDREAVVLIESGESFQGLMPAERIEVRPCAVDENTRTIQLATGSSRGVKEPASGLNRLL